MFDINKIINEELQSENDDEQVIIPGIGKMKISNLKKDLDRKLQDLVKRAKSGQYDTIAASNIEVMLQYWFSLVALEREESLPQYVKIELK